MSKLKLDLDDLVVESFDPSIGGSAAGAGTVFGRSEPLTQPGTNFTDCDLNACADWTNGGEPQCLTMAWYYGCTYLQHSCIDCHSDNCGSVGVC